MRLGYLALAYPAPPEEGHQPALRLHLPVQEGPWGRQGQGAGAVPTGHQPPAGSPAAPAQPDATGLDRLLPLRRVARHLPIPARVHLAAGHRVAATQTPPEQLEGSAPPPLPQTVVARRRGSDAVRPREGTDDPLPLPGRSDSLPMAQHGVRSTTPTGLVERPLLGNGHDGCGGRSGETGWSQGWHRAPDRPYLLGLKGTMSEAELHVLAGRLQGAKRAAAERGELRFPLPVGYVYDDEGATVIDPDQEVQAAVGDVFAAFKGRRFPLRAYGGVWAGQLRWGRLTHSRVLGILANPAYAGTYVFGRY